MDKRSPLDILSNPQHDSVYSSQHRSATVGDKQFRSLQKPPPVQDRSFRVKKYPHHDALSPLSKTQNSWTKGAPTDRDISGGFTFVNRNRPPTFDKTASGFRPTIRNQIDTWNDSVFSIESTQPNFNVAKPSLQLDSSRVVGIHGHPQQRLTKQLGAANSHFTHRSDPFQNSDLKDISRITSPSKDRTYDSD